MFPANANSLPENQLISLDPWPSDGLLKERFWNFFQSHLFSSVKCPNCDGDFLQLAMAERRFTIPTVEQIEQHKRKSKGTNYFKPLTAQSSSTESSTVTPTPNAVTETPPQVDSSAVQTATSSPSAASPQVPERAARRLGPNAILVNQAQRGNPILQHVRNVPWEYDDIKADYVVGQTTCVLYLR